MVNGSRSPYDPFYPDTRGRVCLTLFILVL